VLADLTHARPSVYFEVGYAQGLGVPLLLTCRKDHYRAAHDNARVHFDLEQYKISFWSRNSKGQFIWAKGMEPTKRLKSLVARREEST
jgi:nucleoside 2-deoxyribosyltransferase